MQQENIPRNDNRCLYLSDQEEDQIPSEVPLGFRKIRVLSAVYIAVHQCDQHNAADPQGDDRIERSHRGAVGNRLEELFCFYFYEICEELAVHPGVIAQKIREHVRLVRIIRVLHLGDDIGKLTFQRTEHRLQTGKRRVKTFNGRSGALQHGIDIVQNAVDRFQHRFGALEGLADVRHHQLQTWDQVLLEHLFQRLQICGDRQRIRLFLQKGLNVSRLLDHDVHLIGCRPAGCCLRFLRKHSPQILQDGQNAVRVLQRLFLQLLFRCFVNRTLQRVYGLFQVADERLDLCCLIVDGL